MQWPKKPQSADLPWWGWLLIPFWGPALLMLIALLYLHRAKRLLLGPTEEWRPWFAWCPVIMRSWEGQDDRWVWLEWLERRADHPLGDPEYSTPSRAEGA